jgi:tripartite-type tricarboxylate transporter receptor subunit TctC
MDRRTLLKSGLAIGVGAALPALGQDTAGSYPNRPVKVVVAFGPGGSTDLTARAINAKMTQIFGQSFFVDNKAGGGSNIGAELAARSAPDGYTLFLGTISNAVNMSLYKDPRYDYLKDFAPISILSTAPAVLVVHPKVPATTVKELSDLAKAKPGALNYASSGVGTTPHLAGEMLKQRMGINIVHVAYKGAGPALLDQIAGVTDLGFVTALSAIPSIQAGRLRVLGVAASRRLALMPDVPTLAEAGLPDFEITSWNGLFAPAKTDPTIIQKLNEACVQISKMPDVQKTFADQAAVSLSSTPEQFRAFIQKEIKVWGDVIKSVGIEQV